MDLNLVSKEHEECIDIVCFYLSKQTKNLKIKLTLGPNSRGAVIVLANLVEGSKLSLETQQHHLFPRASSYLLCKTLVGTNSKFNYSGKIVIGKQGDKSHAYERNENLLLGSEATVISEPTLEILADDVYCTHGAATGYLNADEIYYLQTRGFSYKTAWRLLTRGFLLSGLDKLLIEENVSAREFAFLSKMVSNHLLLDS